MSDVPDYDLDFRVSRRLVLRALLRETQVLSGALRGSSAFALSGLADLPDRQLGRLVPLMRPNLDIQIEAGRIWGRVQDTGAAIDLLPALKENVLTLNLFDGQRTLKAAASRLADQMAWDEPRAFAHVRSVFLSLAGRLICLPRNAPDPEQ